jgi:hypothetical protein
MQYDAMKLGTRRLVPLFFLLFSLFYLAFSFSLEEHRMIGDEKGWDPGSRSLPIAMGFLMLGLSVYLISRETVHAPADRPVPAGARRLVLLTITASLLYILIFRALGFLLSTAVLLFTLVYFNRRQDVRRRLLPGYLLGVPVSAAFTLMVYSIGRFLTRFLFYWGRARESGLLTNKAFGALAAALVLAALFAGLLVLLGKAKVKPALRDLGTAVLLAAGVTEGLLLVFKQIFLVNLARGIIFW